MTRRSTNQHSIELQEEDNENQKHHVDGSRRIGDGCHNSRSGQFRRRGQSAHGYHQRQPDRVGSANPDAAAQRGHEQYGSLKSCTKEKGCYQEKSGAKEEIVDTPRIGHVWAEGIMSCQDTRCGCYLCVTAATPMAVACRARQPDGYAARNTAVDQGIYFTDQTVVLHQYSQRGNRRLQ